jgi:hypothetical protein
MVSHIERRKFLAALGGAAAGRPEATSSRVSWPSLASLNPQAWRSMCGCTLNGIFAAFPSLIIIRGSRRRSWELPARLGIGSG